MNPIIILERLGKTSLAIRAKSQFSWKATRACLPNACVVAGTEWGMSRTQIVNILDGVTKGFEKKLEINGVGYRATMQGKNLQLALGFSHDVVYEPPQGITFAVETPTRRSVSP